MGGARGESFADQRANPFVSSLFCGLIAGPQRRKAGTAGSMGCIKAGLEQLSVSAPGHKGSTHRGEVIIRWMAHASRQSAKTRQCETQTFCF